jgi:hypothetical protein
MTTTLVQSKWEGHGLPGGKPSNTEPRTTEDTHNTIADARVTIEELHVVEELAVWRVRLTHLQDNRRFWIPYHRTSLVWAFFCCICKE